MIQQMETATLFVSDQDAALEFYTETLGFQKRADNTAKDGTRYVVVGLKDQEVGIVLWEGTPQPPKGAATGGTGGAWVLATDDLEGDFERLEAQGVKFEQEAPTETPWATYVTLVDPDGNRLNLQRPASPV